MSESAAKPIINLDDHQSQPKSAHQLRAELRKARIDIAVLEKKLAAQMADLTWMPLDARERFEEMLQQNFTGSINDDEIAEGDYDMEITEQPAAQPEVLEQITLNEALASMAVSHDRIDSTNIVQALRHAKQEIFLEYGVLAYDELFDVDFVDGLLITASRNGQKDIFFA